MISPILVMVGLAIILGAVLGVAAIKFRVEGNPLIDKVDAAMPQAQCGQCGYPGCRPYAEAIVAGQAPINLCVPGGDDTGKQLSDLMGVEYKPLGGEGAEPKGKQVAFVDEDNCIGCTACIKACPVDAIVGSNKMMHTIVANLCTGCELCVPACPVECIAMVPVRVEIATWKWQYPEKSLLKKAA